MHQQAQLRLKKDDVEKLGSRGVCRSGDGSPPYPGVQGGKPAALQRQGPICEGEEPGLRTALSDPAGYASAIYGVARKCLRWGARVENQPHWFVIDHRGTLTFMLEPKFDTPTAYEKDVDLVLEALKKAAR
jgi:hypothetical protein